MSTKGIVKLVLAALVLLFVGVPVLLSLWVTDEGERYVITRLGEVSRVQDAGLSWKVPYIEDKHLYPVRVVRTTYDKIESYTNDNQLITSNISVAWHYDPAQLERIYINYGTNFSGLMERFVIGSYKEVMGKINTTTLASERAKIADEATKDLASKLAPFGVLIIRVELVDVFYSKEFERKIEEFVTEKAEAEKAIQIQRKQRTNAETKVVIAKGDADARKQAADAAAYEIFVKRKAEADGIKLVGDAEASRLVQRANAIRQNPALINLLQAEATLLWNGQLPTQMIPGAALPILNVGAMPVAPMAIQQGTQASTK